MGVALVTPLAFAAGFTGPASGVFDAYRFFCAQTPSHSFFIAGYQTCLCSRCLAIYTSILVAGIALTLLRNNRRLRAIPWYVWLLGMVPMALDGFTQLFGLRESNLALRLLTGAIFGVTTAWFLFPQIEEAAHQEQPAPNPAAYAAMCSSARVKRLGRSDNNSLVRSANIQPSPDHYNKSVEKVGVWTALAPSPSPKGERSQNQKRLAPHWSPWPPLVGEGGRASARPGEVCTPQQLKRRRIPRPPGSPHQAKDQRRNTE